MTTSWPEHTLDESKFSDVFQLAQTFELHCAKIYDHASTNPDGSASAHYVMQLVSQAYRAVHSLHMQQRASSYLDLGTATAALENKAVEYREGLALSPADDHSVGIETANGQTKSAPIAGIEGLLDGDFEDEEDDSDWEGSEEETDDEYYEYNEGSDSDCDSALEDLAVSSEIVFGEDKPVDSKSPLARNNATEIQKPVEEQTPPPPPVSITQDKAMHDRITEALQTLSLPCNEPEDAPLTRVETHIDCPPTNTDSTTPSTDDTHEDTAVQVESRQEMPREIPRVPDTLAAGSAMRNHSLDASLPRKLSSRSSAGSLRRLKTVCHKYVGRALVPIRGRSN